MGGSERGRRHCEASYGVASSEPSREPVLPQAQAEAPPLNLSRASVAFVGAFTGRVHGSTIDLDATPSAPFEGKRVRVVLELADEDLRLSAEEQASAWAAWIAKGPDGPLEDDGEPEIP